MSESSSLIGRTLADRYRIESEIARGGMSTVYRARDVRLERDVAVKVLGSPYADDPSFTARFLDEARAAASLSHPSLVHVYDSGSDGPSHYIVMELLDRHRSLHDRLASESPLPADEVVRIGRELLGGLRVVHEHGLVHCDVKPANVMLGPGPAKLIDFGIATPPHDGTDAETSIGSLRFMSPEQLHGEALTPASDVFSLGAVLYQALTGRPPYPGETPEEVSAAHAAGRVRPPSTLVDGVPGRLDEAILQALRRNPDGRFGNADAMAVALQVSADEMAGARDDDTTQVVRMPPPAQAQEGAPPGSYVPPAAPPAPVSPPPSRRPPGAPPPRGRGSAWALAGTLGLLGAAALVFVLVVLPLLQLGREGGAGTTPTPTVAPTAEPGTNTVTVPDLVGEPTADAIAAASEAGLNWTLFCNENPERPEGIIDQEPPAGTQVARGSKFSLYSARFADCQ
jgi:eukaryotic-like serine/threonine-protein kinase